MSTAEHTTPPQPAVPLPGADPETERSRRRDLRRHKAVATGLLVLATVIYLVCRYLEARGQDGAWTGYVRAASEAGMVGALADWFAVTALFRHPLGIPIPHTAIIRRKKDQVGHALSEFVGENFLNATLISEKLRQARIPERAADWVLDGGGAERVSAEAGKLIDVVVTGLDPADVEQVIRAFVVDSVTEPEWAPPLGRGLGQLIEEGRTEPVVDAVVVWLDERARASEDLVVRLLDERTPAWAPRFVRELVGARVYRELVEFTADVRRNPDHEARRALRRFLRQLADDLQHDPAMIGRVERLKNEVMESAPVRALPGRLWERARVVLTDMARDPESLLRRRIVRWSTDVAGRVRTDADLRASLESRIVGGAAYLAENYAGEVTGIIGETVERWDADEASDRIELMVGKDLQFIRVNGTVVGALAGLVIYTVSQAVFSLV
ncbi:DUF445 domain-containing protein [Corynebacterium bovis]|uniref:DUF445 domain-containing protein n=1 Tax=Corynebacterium bovis TaxID=36808 RepID=A0A3R8R568_9CORY|nr:DUF445 family protein [Corynebacterium bovis]RRO91191.1 DUF445 domain-containing protein [Corynebacterium bovis]RRO97936.1 DUF445 domain-containing protein [Corynebacterium bovis]RRO98442.1 DUF445 domain-containing protein [Corynebacterium bovis]RRQ01637.1 DUF445 domain-containing protein [Corynebacterium bovis]RRQ02004.1 DUF445 domain-containing protein [Corynebacterium bovis]